VEQNCMLRIRIFGIARVPLEKPNNHIIFRFLFALSIFCISKPFLRRALIALVKRLPYFSTWNYKISICMQLWVESIWNHPLYPFKFVITHPITIFAWNDPHKCSELYTFVWIVWISMPAMIIQLYCEVQNNNHTLLLWKRTIIIIKGSNYYQYPDPVSLH
jgi:hypothetical protein